jgi:hypothetical protein
MTEERIKHIFKYMEYGALSEAQENLIISFEKQFEERGSLSERQYEILEDIFKQAAEKW